MVGRDTVPLGRVLGSEVGRFLQQVHESKGVAFRLGVTPSRIDERQVTLSDGSTLPAELVVVGVGVKPRTALAEAAGLRVDNGILVDEQLRTSAPNVWAAGDVARYPYNGRQLRIEHWVVAQSQGQAAARAMLGQTGPFRAVPYFWSNHHDVPMGYIGHVERWDRMEIHGSLEARDACIAYWEGGRIRAVATVGRDRARLLAEAAMERGHDRALEAHRLGCLSLPVSRNHAGDGGSRTRARRPMMRTAMRRKRPLKIATFNVNGVKGRLPRLLEWLAETKPDVACLQEIKTGDATFPASAIEDAGYHAIWHGQRSHHGVAILARGVTPVEVRRGLPGEPEDVAARYLEADLHGLRSASVYLPNGNPVPSPNFDYKQRWMERLITHAQTLMDSGLPVILAGDFNVVPTNNDIYNAGTWRFDAVLQPETREKYARLLSQGWIDATRQLHPKERLYTFWVNAGAFHRNAGFRMDFLLLTPSLVPRLAAAEVDAEHRGREKPSDHAPVWIRLKG